MPTIVIEGYKFRFYSSDRHEPPHVHVIRGDGEAKVWLDPVALEYAYGYARPEVNRIVRIASQHRSELLEAWYGYFAR